jgi:acetyl esterase
MDVYLPTQGGIHPGVVLIHPGGFVSGDKSMMAAVGTFVAAHGYVAFSIEYRSARDVPYPAAVQDTRTAIDFIRTNASTYQTDPLRIGILGASAGGTIGASAADEGNGTLDEGTRVAAVVTWSAPFDFVTFLPERPNVRGPVLKYAGIQEGHGRETVVPSSEQDDLLRRASPINYVDPSDPPMFLVNAPREFIPLDQAQAMAARLKQNDVSSESFEPKRGHALDYTDEALQPSVDFLDRYLRDYQPESGSGRPTSPSQPSSGGGKPSSGGGSNGFGGGGWMLILGVVAVAIVLVLLSMLAARRHRT